MTQPTEPKNPPKRINWLAVLPVLVFVGLAGIFFVQLRSNSGQTIPSTLIGKAIPQFQLPPIDGLSVPGLASTDLMQGKVTIVNIWSSWCVPCRDEHSLLSELAKDTRIQVVGINYKDQPENARRFLGQFGNPFARIGADIKGRTAIEWGVYGTPETFLIDKTGHIAHKHIGPLTAQAITQTVLPLIEAQLAKP